MVIVTPYPTKQERSMGSEFFNMAVQSTNEVFGAALAVAKNNPWDKYFAEVTAITGPLNDREIERLSVLFRADVKAGVAARRIIEGASK